MAETVEVPIHILPTGQQFIAKIDCVECPEIQAFVDRFPEYWTDDPLRSGYVGPIPRPNDTVPEGPGGY